MGPLTTEITERFRHDERLRARFGEVTVADDAPVHLVELGTRQLAVVTVRTELGPVVLASGPALRSAAADRFADFEHVATLWSGAELWAVVGATDLLAWVRGSSTTADRRRVGLALLQLGETLHRDSVRHGAVEGATVVVSDDGEPMLLPWTGERDDDRARLQALGVAVLGSAVDRTLGHSFGSLGLLRPADLVTPGDGERWAALDALSDDRRGPPDLRFALQRAVDSLVRVCGDAGASSVLDADVRFSAFHPASAPEHDWARLLVLAHHGGQATDARGDVVDVEQLVAGAVREQFGTDTDVERSSSVHPVPVLRGEQLTFTVHCSGADVDAPSQTVGWTGPLEEVIFWLHPRPGATSMEGAVEIYVGAFVRGRIPFSIPVGVEAVPTTSRTTVDAYRDVFVSYAHEDRVVVDALIRLNTLGDRFLVDAEELRAGQDWRARLGELIREAEVFQLFWSDASSRSAEVQVEWRQALDLRDPAEFIRPVYWEHPMPPVPEPLDGLHFDFVPLGGGGAPILSARTAAPTGPGVAVGPRQPGPPAEGQTIPSAATPAPPSSPARTPSGQRWSGSWLEGFTRVAMVLVALFGFGAVFAGLVFEDEAGDEIGEGVALPSTIAPDATAPPTAPPPTGGSTPPTTGTPGTSASTTVSSSPPTSGQPPPPSTEQTTTPPTSLQPPPSTEQTTTPPTSLQPPPSTEPLPPEPTLFASVAGPVDGTIDSSRYPVELIVGNGPVTIEAITAVDLDGDDVTVTAPDVPRPLDVGRTVLVIDIASEVGSIGEITLLTDIGPVTVSDLP